MSNVTSGELKRLAIIKARLQATRVGTATTDSMPMLDFARLNSFVSKLSSENVATKYVFSGKEFRVSFTKK